MKFLRMSPPPTPSSVLSGTNHPAKNEEGLRSHSTATAPTAALICDWVSTSFLKVPFLAISSS